MFYKFALYIDLTVTKLVSNRGFKNPLTYQQRKTRLSLICVCCSC